MGLDWPLVATIDLSGTTGCVQQFMLFLLLNRFELLPNFNITFIHLLIFYFFAFSTFKSSWFISLKYNCCYQTHPFQFLAFLSNPSFFPQMTVVTLLLPVLHHSFKAHQHLLFFRPEFIAYFCIFSVMLWHFSSQHSHGIFHRKCNFSSLY